MIERHAHIWASYTCNHMWAPYMIIYMQSYVSTHISTEKVNKNLGITHMITCMQSCVSKKVKSYVCYSKDHAWVVTYDQSYVCTHVIISEIICEQSHVSVILMIFTHMITWEKSYMISHISHMWAIICVLTHDHLWQVICDQSYVCTNMII